MPRKLIILLGCSLYYLEDCATREGDANPFLRPRQCINAARRAATSLPLSYSSASDIVGVETRLLVAPQ